MLNSIAPIIDIIKFKYEFDSKFKIIIKTKIKRKVTIIFNETNSNDFEYFNINFSFLKSDTFLYLNKLNIFLKIFNLDLRIFAKLTN
tara:strand:- start:1835 stop:2095 length:261 start_codon:yes stop_codon:yes gene_type:complete